MNISSRAKLILTSYLITRLVFSIFASLDLSSKINQRYISAGHSLDWVITPHKWIDIWYRWDSNSYMDIITHGYHLPNDITRQTSTLAFFPLYPLLIKAIAFVFVMDSKIDYFVIGVAISQLFLIFGLKYLHKITEKITNTRTANTTIIILLSFPHSFFYSSFEAYSMFLFLSTFVIWHTMHNKWLLAGVFGLLTSATKHIGITIVIPILISYLDTIHWKIKSIDIRSMLSILIAPFGTMAYFIYCYTSFGNLFLPIIAQKAWHRSLDFNLQNLLNGHLSIFPYFDQLMVAINSIAIITVYKKTRNIPITSLGLLFSFLPLFTGTIHSYARFSILNICTFIGLGIFAEKYFKKTTYIIIAIFMIMQMYALYKWKLFYWVG